MKLLAIAFKDVWHSVRNAFFLVFGLGLPLLTTLLFYFAFGGGGGDVGSTIVVDVQVANLDVPGEQAGVPPLGEMVVEALLGQGASGLLNVTLADGADAARAAVDNQQADVAVIIPANFTAAMVGEGERATVELYQDPTLTIGPAIVKSIVGQLVDSFAGARIAVGVAFDQMAEQGGTPDAAMAEEIAVGYTMWVLSTGQNGTPLLDVQAPPGVREEAGQATSQALTLIMTGMMLFYVFFTGTASSQSILQEEDAGTLSRIFTTPTPQSTILGGKFLATLAVLVVQVAFLTAAGALVFDIDWGAPLPVALAILGLVVLSAGFGIFVNSLVKNTKQAGGIYGGVLTILGLVGISSVFTAGAPESGSADIARTLSLFTPHGWAMRAWTVALEGGGVGDVLFPVAVMLALSAAFFTFGVLRFRKRFA
ncbi:MAG: ABC transporter permease subunit [Anaerolineae bacterium]|nr:ABC transporter permease subunit [Anaerolineae bacterium]